MKRILFREVGIAALSFGAGGAVVAFIYHRPRILAIDFLVLLLAGFCLMRARR